MGGEARVGLGALARKREIARVVARAAINRQARSVRERDMGKVLS